MRHRNLLDTPSALGSHLVVDLGLIRGRGHDHEQLQCATVGPARQEQDEMPVGLYAERKFRGVGHLIGNSSQEPRRIRKS